MFAEENSKMISNLYNAKSRREISDVLEYMGESGSCIFIYPILDGYKKYKYTSVGYYFIWSLSRLDYPDLGRQLNELLQSYEIEKSHIPMTLFFMSERRFFSDIANRMAAMYLDYWDDPEFRNDFNLDALGMRCILEYMNRAGILANFEKRLRELVLNEDTGDPEKADILTHLFNIDQGRQADFFAGNYFSCIRGSKLEKNIARQLVFCAGSKVAGLKKLIMENGSAEAAEVLEKYGRWSAGKNAEDAIVYDNMDAVIKIGILRGQINDKASSRTHSGFRVFPESELLPHQSQGADDKEIFFGLCENLLGIIISTDPQVREHGFSEEEACGILERAFGVSEDHDLANLFLYINSKKIAVDGDFYGLKELDKALRTLLSRSEDEEFYESLRHMGIEDMYREGQWHKIHSFFLNSYIQSLENMNKCFNQLAKQSLE